MSDWTPGPWRIADEDWPKRILSPDGTILGTYGPSHEANARLIAAAPEMAALLVFIRDNGYEPPDTSADIEALLSRINTPSERTEE